MLLTPLLQFRVIQHTVGVAATHKNDHATVSSPIGQDMVDRGSKRRQAQAAGYKEDIGPSRCSDWPAGAEWPTHANRSAGFEFGERSADGANLAYSVNETGRVGRAADADGDFPDAEGIQHIELTRLKRWP
jgi:hypothetical protein